METDDSRMMAMVDDNEGEGGGRRKKERGEKREREVDVANKMSLAELRPLSGFLL